MNMNNTLDLSSLREELEKQKKKEAKKERKQRRDTEPPEGETSIPEAEEMSA